MTVVNRHIDAQFAVSTMSAAERSIIVPCIPPVGRSVILNVVRFSNRKKIELMQLARGQTHAAALRPNTSQSPVCADYTSSNLSDR